MNGDETSTRDLNMTGISKTQSNGQRVVEQELERLKKVLNRGQDLKVKWIPGNNGKLSGEVKGDLILVYDKQLETALETLKHEFIDYAVSEVIEPYMQVTNKLIALLNERAYHQKELLVGRLFRLL